MMRCPIHGPRPDAEFKRIGEGVTPADGRGMEVELWKHNSHRCGRFVWRLPPARKRILAASN